MLRNPDTYVIVPVYNEETVISDVVNELLESFDNVVCVNDGSVDSSKIEIQNTKAVIINHPVNLGQGAALQTGIEYALNKNAKYFITFDSDGQHRLSDALRMLETLKISDCDIVLGSRFLSNDNIAKDSDSSLDDEENTVPLAKRILLKLALFGSNISTGLTLTDTHNGLRVFTGRFARALEIKMSDMSHASEIIDCVSKNKFKYMEEAVTIDYTEYSKQKGQPIINAVNIAFDIVLRSFSK